VPLDIFSPSSVKQEDEMADKDIPELIGKNRTLQAVSAGRPVKAQGSVGNDVKTELEQCASGAALPEINVRYRQDVADANADCQRWVSTPGVKMDIRSLLGKVKMAKVKAKLESTDKGMLEAKRRKLLNGGPDAKVKTERDSPVPSFEVRLPFFIAQCTAFQLANRIWRPSRPCCLANCILNPPVAPHGGLACYQRMDQEQRRHFRNVVDGPEVEAKALRGQVSVRTFTMLLHPERVSRVSIRRRSINNENEESIDPCRREVEGDVAIIGGRSIPTAIARAKARQEMLRGDKGGERRSGMRGITWNERTGSWIASWQEAIGDAQDRKTRKYMRFPVSRYRVNGRSQEEADKACLEDAIIFREKLISDGKVFRARSRESENKGLSWSRSRGGWDVFFRVHGKKLRGGHFRPLNTTPEGIEQARQAAAECRRQLEMKYGRHGQSIQMAVREKVQTDMEVTNVEVASPLDKEAPQRKTPQKASKPEAPPQGDACPERRGSRRLISEVPAQVLGPGPQASEADARQRRVMEVPAQALGPAPQALDADARQRRGMEVTWRRYGCQWRVEVSVDSRSNKWLFQSTSGTLEEVERELLAACSKDLQ